MRIGIASLIDLGPFGPRLDNWDYLAEGLAFPYLSTLALALHARGHEIHVFALNQHIDRPRQYKGDRLTIDVLPMRVLGRDRVRDNYRQERRYLEAAMRMSGCDVIHAHWTYEFGAAAVASGLPNVVTAHDEPWKIVAESRHIAVSPDGRSLVSTRLRGARRETPRALMSHWVVARADVVTAVSPNVAAHLNRWMRPRRPAAMIPNGLPPEERSPRSAVRNQAEPVFGFVANGFGNRKNTIAALRAFGVVRAGLPSARLILMGREHGESEAGQVWAQAQGLDVGCEWRGSVPNAEALTALANEVDVLLHPSYWEACSIAIMEAQSLGIPVIGNRDTQGTAFSLQDGAAGVLVDVDDSTAFADAMRHLVSDEDHYASVSRGAIDALTGVFNLDLVADAYEGVYAQAIGQRRG